MSQNNKSPINTTAFILGALAIGTIIYDIFKPSTAKSKIKHRGKARVFISFAKDDEIYRDYLVKQAKSNRSPFSFFDMSVKKPWPEDIWKKKCRTKIKGCDGVIVLLSGKTWNSSGARWEIKCAKEENIPVVGMHIFKNNIKSIIPELENAKVIPWDWKELENIISKF
ncbi:TIR domain-containing protein [Tenacibaculum aestuarii]|uniref:TIR domain-containing protein n=1 Tax=Tenacibaculum aestuarii TaxID=362781 RepID=UPI0038964AFC